jgi:pimeloyl-ACP methyl ester carboxylesterase
MGDPVVFVPGLACTEDLFSHQIRALSGTRTIVLANHRRHATLHELAGELLADLPQRFVLAGLSMGGYVAFEILRRAAERVAAVVLLDTSARPDTPEAQERRQRMIAIAEAGRLAEIAALQTPLLVAPDRAEDPDLVATIRTMHEATGAQAYVRQQRAIITRPDSRPSLAAISCPALVIVGDRDQLTPPDVAAEIAAGIRGARFVTMPACGHLATIERPEAVTHAITDFLDQAGV